MAAVLLASIILSVILLVSDTRTANEEAGKIIRNGYGQGEKTESIVITAGGKKIKTPLEITVGEKQYTQEEIQEIFKTAIRKLEIIVLGNNSSLDNVRDNLNLPASISGQPIEITWELDRYDVMNIYGELQTEALKEYKEGTVVHLKAFLKYSENPSMEAVHEMAARIYPPSYSGERKVISEVKEKIEEKERNTPSKEIIKLPKEVNGKDITYNKPMNYRGFIIFAMGIVIVILLKCLEYQEIKKESEQKKAQMLMDYPEIINKLTLLLGAGMTVKSAWTKITSDYEKQKNMKGVRYAYEEMRTCCHEMNSGISEIECYERFGRRCGQQAYLKLGALLSQNLRKGTKGLTELLRIESIHAFEERKSLAKRQGEEAGTKLLLPMFFMLGIVLVIVVVPAFLSIQL